MASVREIKEKLNAEFARIGHALSSPKRLELLELLRQCEKTVETLAANSGMSVANTSRHLQVLRGAGLAEARRDGVYIYYRLAGDEIYALVSSMKTLAESRLAEVERMLAQWADDPAEVEIVDRRKLLRFAKSGEIVLLDVRPRDEYEAEHLPHALSIPLEKLKGQVEKLPAGQRVVAYCRGPYCVLAGEAVRLLRSRGFDAARLGDGVAEWRDAGMPVARVNKRLTNGT